MFPPLSHAMTRRDGLGVLCREGITPAEAMPDTFLIGSVEHTKGGVCKSCFNGFPYNCPSKKCDGYLHGHQVTLGAAMQVQTQCDLCGEEWANECQ